MPRKKPSLAAFYSFQLGIDGVLAFLMVSFLLTPAKISVGIAPFDLTVEGIRQLPLLWELTFGILFSCLFFLFVSSSFVKALRE